MNEKYTKIFKDTARMGNIHLPILIIERGTSSYIQSQMAPAWNA